MSQFCYLLKEDEPVSGSMYEFEGEDFSGFVVDADAAALKKLVDDAAASSDVISSAVAVASASPERKTVSLVNVYFFFVIFFFIFLIFFFSFFRMSVQLDLQSALAKSWKHFGFKIITCQRNFQ